MRRIALVIGVGAFLALAGCGGTPPTTASSPKAEETPQKPEGMADSVETQRVVQDSVGTQEDGPEARLYAYECTDALRFATAMRRDTVRLFLPGRKLTLPRVWAMDGAKYRNGSTLFWRKGERKAILKVAGSHRRRHCQRDPQRDALVTARMHGVDMRAAGVAPGWRLDIAEGERITFVGGAGERRMIVAAPVPDTVRTARRARKLTVQMPKAFRKLPPPYLLYRAATSTNALTVVIKDRLCRDKSSGQGLEKTVLVQADSTVYRGCGRALY